MIQQKIRLFLFITFTQILFSCSEKQNSTFDFHGQYRAAVEITSNQVPFFLNLKKSGEKWTAEILNGEEVLNYNEVYVEGDSIRIVMGIFDAEIKAKITEQGKLQGVFVKNFSTGYSIPFLAEKGDFPRFPTQKTAEFDFSGKWKTDFEDSNGKTYEAIALFEQEGSKLTGTFLTKLGDYRFLEGNVEGNTFYLSAFDGSHVYYFQGSLSEDGTINGKFRSGPKYQETFRAERNESFELPDAYSMNYLKEGFDKFTFAFPDVDGKIVSLEDDAFKDKVVLVQLFGTWCPNCMDETKFLAEWYKKNKSRGVEIIALAFESKPDFDYASGRVRKTKERMGAEYTFLIAGESNKEKASEALPALNQVIAFPTLIYLDRSGQVRKIHTGFSGPGTGEYYQRWVDEHETFVNELLSQR
ncbi:TlpA disulfide reductase family protein [Cecembia rubra]|uniref:Cytochrome oxidase Cu insertion factor (SCO1/SenC/PrrC family) n=1 Tax=Cecembia rubra TaxID=1485585 RepID=A0A2P8E832_9BACT|nr:TlpA disulfide reductase family protein [Cecembia rubra]PSL05625.1 cytochrome oxidase Cu insertion factor (SCO1/SenC/PrrC family) [Cecembia rubra]